MTTINFPSAPTVGQVYTLGEKSWVYMAIRKDI